MSWATLRAGACTFYGESRIGFRELYNSSTNAVKHLMSCSPRICQVYNDKGAHGEFTIILC